MGSADTCYPSGEGARVHARWASPAPHNYSLPLKDLAALHNEGGQAGSLAPPVVANDVSSRFGRRLRELRLERNLTQSNMARKFGIDRSFISDVERGRKSISLALLEVIAIGLEISLSTLLDGI